ncbi:MAG TPA: cyclic nucleotide-binding domain-containing protein, partial [Symbiobacteriaceae bacterium]|nr:cyclic nucleotide-binding domain-containing protein [Symbiobacteriaceae bacterium]
MTLADLRALPLLAGLNDMDLARLRTHLAWSWHQPGERLLEPGQLCTDFFIIAGGQVEIVLPGEIATRLALLGPGDFFGERAALTGEPAPTAAVALEVTTTLRLTAEGFLLLLEAGGEPVRRIIAGLSARAGEAAERLHRTRLR